MATLEQIGEALRKADSLATSAGTAAEREEARNDAKRLALAYRDYNARAKSAELEHPRKPDAKAQAVSEASSYFGVPASDVQFGGTLADRLNLGVWADTPPEERRLFEIKAPGKVAQLGGGLTAYQNEQGKVVIPRDPGQFSFGDVVQGVAGEALPTALAIGAGMAFPGSFVAAPAIGSFLGEMGKQGMQEAAGINEQGLLAEPAKRAAWDVAFGLPLKGTSGLLNIKPSKDPLMRERLMDIQKARDTGMNLEPPFSFQITRNPFATRIGAQAASTHPAALPKMTAMKKSAFDSADAMLDMPIEDADTVLRNVASASSSEKRRNILDQFPSFSERKMGERLGQITDNWIAKSQEVVSNLFDNANRIGARVRPQYDLSQLRNQPTNHPAMASQTRVGEITRNPDGTENIERIVEYIDAAEPGFPQLQRVQDIIDNVDPVQDHRVVNALRQRAGHAIERLNNSSAPEAMEQLGIAKRMYARLSDLQRNPTNIDQASPYVRAVSRAIDTASTRLDYLTNSRVQNILHKAILEESPDDLAQMFLKQPGAWNRSVEHIIASEPVAGDRLVREMQRNILQQPDPRKYVENMPVAQRNFITERVGRSNFNNALNAITKLNSSRVQQIAESIDQPINVAKQLLSDPKLDKLQVRELLNDLGGEGTRGHRVMVLATIEDILDKSGKRGEWGEYIDPTAFSAQINKYKKNGVWDTVLSDVEKTRLKGLESYIWTVKDRGKDTGTSLEQAAAYANLKHPATFMRGFHALAANRAIGAVLMNPRLSNYMFEAKTLGRYMSKPNPLPYKLSASAMSATADYLASDF